MASSSKTLTPQRKHRKLLKDGSGAEVWPESVEAVFVQGLHRYWDSPYATYAQPRGRSRWRNQFLVDYLEKAGIYRTKKQVASHIQVLRNMWKGQSEFYLVAAGDDSSSDASSPPIKLEDRSSCDITTLIPFDFDDADPPSPAPSPDFSPIDSHLDFPPTPTQLNNHLAPFSYKDLPSVLSTSTPSSVFTLDSVTQNSHEHGPYYPLENPTFAQPSPIVKPAPHPSSYLQYYPNYCTAFRLLADGMTPFSVNLDTLMSSQLHSGSALVLKIKLSITSVDDTRSLSSLHGFSAGVSLARVWMNSGKCVTRVHTQDICISEETAVLEISNVEYGIANLLLPESALSRCRWLDTSLQTQLTQEIIVDNETLIYLIYDLDRSGGVMPSAELLGYQSRKTTITAPPQPNPSSSKSYPIFHSQLSPLPYPRHSTQTSLSNALTPSPTAASVY